MHRRQFLHAATGLMCGGALATLPRRSANAFADPEKLTIGFLGAAYSHAAPKLTLLRNHPDYELGCHMVDAIVRLLGKPDTVTPFLHTHGPQNDSLRDNMLAVFEYPRAIATISCATFQPSSGAYRAFEVLGTNGTATLRPIEEPATLVMDLAKAAGPYQSGVNRQEWPNWERFVGEFVELAAAVRGQRSLSVTPEQEIAIQETLLAASGVLK